jgi:SNF2 family DNA or RNA helicase
MAGCAQRDSIPTKIELEDINGNRIPPEKADTAKLGDLQDSERSALFALTQWCQGKLSSFLQLNLKQAAELVNMLVDTPCFFLANQPEQAIPWQNGKLINVSEYLPDKSVQHSRPVRQLQDKEASEFHATIIMDLPEYKGPPIEVEGSTEYLRIVLPSSEHPCYKEVLSLLREWNFLRDRTHRHWWWLRDSSKVLDFLASHQETLELDFEAEFTENFQKLTRVIGKANLLANAKESAEGTILEVKFEAGDTPQEEIEHALATGKNHIRHGKKVYLLTREIKEKATQLHRRMTGDLDTPLLSQFSQIVPKYQSVSLEEDILSADPRFKPPSEWKKRSSVLKNLSSLPLPSLSKELLNLLRPYQQIGVAWLLHLFRNQLGGILADEMGLGKTVQALAFLAALKKERISVSPSLVVCPASLIENWRRETLRFCPEFKVLVHHGSSRTTVPTSLSGNDLIITSYGTLVRDREMFESTPLLCVIGDEAQYLKNRKTQNAKAMSALSSEGRILLTGTPIENSVYDLLSLLEFLLPGARPEIPYSSRGEDRIWHEQKILKEAAPYLLRRQKKEVAPELPEKIEQILHIQLSDEQKDLYQKVRQSSESELDKLAISGASEGTLRMKTLTQLLRLRQTCCDPRLIDEVMEADHSAKLRAFRELLYNCLDGGHRLLVFSQFVKVLQFLKADLESSSLPYCYLDGSSSDRMAQVDRFQEDDSIPVFLISLKAGGTGLNLTAADVVVHFDPWWNPAIETQATDRAHRIGQDRVVTVYKLIASDTVEEKVLQLQHGKRKLLEKVFEESEASNLKLSISDLRKLI